MKVSIAWLREFVSVPWSAAELGSRLTMSGFELEGSAPVAPPFSGVQIAEIVSAERHPQADKLRVCGVATGRKDAAGNDETLQIVCGAANARVGLKTALAVVGAQLPGGLNIKAANLRGVESLGMLCSAKELGLADGADGIIELPAEAPRGVALREYLGLDDDVLELNVTPNRGDAMSMLGIAREVAALQRKALAPLELPPVPAQHDARVAVRLEAPAACPRFVGRVIRGVNTAATAPLWLRERLRRAGVRSISAVVDVTNYVLLELGQPMHAYDLGKLQGDVRVRLAAAGEPLRLLDGSDVKLDADMLVIADAAGPVGLAGVMGGERTAVSDATRDVFVEVAFFTPQALAGRGRRLGLVTDAGQRFERGVDPMQQVRAIERATALILQIAGGSPGPTVVTESQDHLPKRTPIVLRRERVQRLLGQPVADADIETVLTTLQLAFERAASGWRVTPAAHRFDLSIEADLIEEVARIVGFDAFAEAPARGPRELIALPESLPDERTVLQTIAARGYQEAITFAFVAPELQAKLFPNVETPTLANPIASDLAVMRASLWPGLINAALENQRRQQDRVRLIEIGTTFAMLQHASIEVARIAGIAMGRRAPERWSHDRAGVDFYDVKQDVESLLALSGELDAFLFEPTDLACLHPGRAASIRRGGKTVGVVGELHPVLVKSLDFTYAPVLFELDWHAALGVRLPAYHEASRFPQVRRDIAVIVDEAVALSRLHERVTFVASSLLREVRVFDVYRGPGIETGRKSIALGLIFQEKSRTLTDGDADRIMTAIRADLSATLGAAFRE
jgi:phenylalanyl-tRNA synthetase beta chain